MTLAQLTFNQSWAGRIPPRWRWSRNKELLTESLALSADGDEELLSVSHLTGITPRSEKTVTMTAAENLEGYRIVEPRDLVINTMWAWMGALGIAKQAGIVSPAYGVYSPRPAAPFEPRFYDYVYRSDLYVMEMTRLSRGIWSSRLRLYPDVFLSMAVPVPPLNEQRAIADYLDRETARIDTLIEEQQRLIEMLLERRVAVISTALTPTDSWARRRIKHIGETSLGKMLDGGRVVRDGDEPRPYVRAADVRADGSVNLVDLNEMPFSEAEMSVFSLRAGDVLLIEGGATVGRPGFLWESAPGIAFQKTVNRLRVGPQVDARFVYWSMLRLYESAYYANHYGAVSFVHLTGEKLREIELHLPSADEQRAIVAYLDEQTAKIDTLIVEAERFIELSKERRAALVTAAVTGQVDVREMV